VTAARGAALAALVVAIAVVAVLLLRGGKEHDYALLFQNAGQLVNGDEVQVGGRPVGSVKDITLSDDNLAKVEISVQDGFAPLHKGTTAVIRQLSLSGVANRYIALSPGPNSAPKLDDGAVLGTDSTTTPVDLDQLFDTFDPRTRKALQQVIHGSATQYDGQGKKGNEAAKYFNPALSSTSQLVNQVISDQQAFTDLVVDSSKVVSALAARRGDLTNLVSNANATAGAIAKENAALEQSLGLLPGTLRKANTTFVNLRSTLGDLDTLVNASKPATKQLAPFFEQLRPLVKNARPTIADLRKLVRQPGSGNDLTDLLREAPGLEKAAKPALANSTQALLKSTPVLDFARPYTPDLTGWLRDFGQGAANYDANGHFARVQPLFQTFDYNAGTNQLELRDPSLAPTGLTTGQFRRCPGSATQPAVDGSSPFQDDAAADCDPTQVLPGP
jgi:phospholipid/cholesterol/gamma-HCH transport system substrate-binding protein